MTRLMVTLLPLGLAGMVLAQTDSDGPIVASADIWLRDCVQDSGNEPSSCPDGKYWFSPDIWMSFGSHARPAGLVVEDQEVASSWRVEIRNRGDAAAKNIQVTLWYRSNAGGLHFPDEKCTVIGTRVLTQDLEPDTSRIVTVVGAGVPQPPPGANYHYCVGAAIMCDGDPAYTSDTVVGSNNKACTNNPYLNHRFDDGDLEVRFNAETPPDVYVPGFHTMAMESELPPAWSVQMQFRETPQDPWVPFEAGEAFWLEGTDEDDGEFRLLIETGDEPVQGEVGTIDLVQLFIDTGEAVGGIGYVVHQDNYPPLPIDDLRGWSGRHPVNRLSWTEPLLDTGGHQELVAFFEVHRSTVAGFEPSPETLLMKTAVDADENEPRWQHVDNDVAPGETYYYKIVAVDYAKWTSQSNEYEALPCSVDFDRSADIGFGDLLRVLTMWGPCPPCPEDIDGDGDVGLSDLLVILSNWGSCP